MHIHRFAGAPEEAKKLLGRKRRQRILRMDRPSIVGVGREGLPSLARGNR